MRSPATSLGVLKLDGASVDGAKQQIDAYLTRHLESPDLLEVTKPQLEKLEAEVKAAVGGGKLDRLWGVPIRVVGRG